MKRKNRIRVWWEGHPHLSHPVARFRGRASKWHPGMAHHEMVCSYEEYRAVNRRRTP